MMKLSQISKISGMNKLLPEYLEATIILIRFLDEINQKIAYVSYNGVLHTNNYSVYLYLENKLNAHPQMCVQLDSIMFVGDTSGFINFTDPEFFLKIESWLKKHKYD